MSWFWQKTQRRLQPEKKIVPEPPAAQAVLLAEVREVGGDDRLPPDRAQTGGIGSTVDLAAARANDAALAEQIVRLGRPALELDPREQCGQHVRCSAAAVFRGSSRP
jgi:hypothetical protein